MQSRCLKTRGVKQKSKEASMAKEYKRHPKLWVLINYSFRELDPHIAAFFNNDPRLSKRLMLHLGHCAQCRVKIAKLRALAKDESKCLDDEQFAAYAGSAIRIPGFERHIAKCMECSKRRGALELMAEMVIGLAHQKNIRRSQ